MSTVKITDTIKAAQYNAYYTRINNILGQTSTGYGRTLLSSMMTFSGGTNPVIHASDLSNLWSDIKRTRWHQIGSDPTSLMPTQATSTQLITAQYFNQYDALLTLIERDAKIVGPTQYTLGTAITSTRTTIWNTVLNHTVTFTFPDANSANYFFNAGGQFQISANISGTLYGNKSYDWQHDLIQLGTIIFNYNNTQSSIGSGVLSNIGYQTLTTTPTVVYTFISNNYPHNTYQLFASINGTGNVITLTSTFTDGTGNNVNDNNFDEVVTGTISSVMNYQTSIDQVNVTAPTMATTASLNDAAIPSANYIIVAMADGNVTTTNDGSNVYAQVYTNGVAPSTTVSWQIANIDSNGVISRTITDDTKGVTQDYFNNTWSGTITLDNDGRALIGPIGIANAQLTVGTQDMVFQLVSGSTVLATSNKIEILNTSRAPVISSLSVTPLTLVKNSGTKFSATISTLNIKPYTQLSVTIINASSNLNVSNDIVVPSNVVVQGDSTSFNITVNNNTHYSTDKTFKIQVSILNNPSINVTSNLLTITDYTSTYALSAVSTTVNEGQKFNFTLTSTNVDSGTVLYYKPLYNYATLSSSNNIFGDQLPGTLLISNIITDTASSSYGQGSSQFTLSTKTTGISANAEFDLGLYNNSSCTGTPVASLSGLWITYVPPAPTTVTITPNVTSVTDGGQVTWTFNTTNFTATSYRWGITGSTGFLTSMVATANPSTVNLPNSGSTSATVTITMINPIKNTNQLNMFLNLYSILDTNLTTILYTSTTPVVINYVPISSIAFVSYSSVISAGSSLTITISRSGTLVADGIQLTWSLTYLDLNISNSDFVTTTGTFTGETFSIGTTVSQYTQVSKSFKVKVSLPSNTSVIPITSDTIMLSNTQPAILSITGTPSTFDLTNASATSQISVSTANISDNLTFTVTSTTGISDNMINVNNGASPLTFALPVSNNTCTFPLTFLPAITATDATITVSYSTIPSKSTSFTLKPKPAPITAVPQISCSVVSSVIASNNIPFVISYNNTNNPIILYVTISSNTAAGTYFGNTNSSNIQLSPPSDSAITFTLSNTVINGYAYSLNIPQGSPSTSVKILVPTYSAANSNNVTVSMSVTADNILLANSIQITNTSVSCNILYSSITIPTINDILLLNNTGSVTVPATTSNINVNELITFTISGTPSITGSNISITGVTFISPLSFHINVNNDGSCPFAINFNNIQLATSITISASYKSVNASTSFNLTLPTPVQTPTAPLTARRARTLSVASSATAGPDTVGVSTVDGYITGTGTFTPGELVTFTIILDPQNAPLTITTQLSGTSATLGLSSPSTSNNVISYKQNNTGLGTLAISDTTGQYLDLDSRGNYKIQLSLTSKPLDTSIGLMIKETSNTNDIISPSSFTYTVATIPSSTVITGFFIQNLDSTNNYLIATLSASNVTDSTSLSYSISTSDGTNVLYASSIGSSSASNTISSNIVYVKLPITSKITLNGTITPSVTSSYTANTTPITTSLQSTDLTASIVQNGLPNSNKLTRFDFNLTSLPFPQPSLPVTITLSVDNNVAILYNSDGTTPITSLSQVLPTSLNTRSVLISGYLKNPYNNITITGTITGPGLNNFSTKLSSLSSKFFSINPSSSITDNYITNNYGIIRTATIKLYSAQSYNLSSNVPGTYTITDASGHTLVTETFTSGNINDASTYVSTTVSYSDSTASFTGTISGPGFTTGNRYISLPRLTTIPVTLTLDNSDFSFAQLTITADLSSVSKIMRVGDIVNFKINNSSGTTVNLLDSNANNNNIIQYKWQSGDSTITINTKVNYNSIKITANVFDSFQNTVFLSSVSTGTIDISQPIASNAIDTLTRNSTFGLQIPLTITSIRNKTVQIKGTSNSNTTDWKFYNGSSVILNPSITFPVATTGQYSSITVNAACPVSLIGITPVIENINLTFSIEPKNLNYTPTITWSLPTLTINSPTTTSVKGGDTISFTVSVASGSIGTLNWNFSDTSTSNFTSTPNGSITFGTSSSNTANITLVTVPVATSTILSITDINSNVLVTKTFTIAPTIPVYHIAPVYPNSQSEFTDTQPIIFTISSSNSVAPILGTYTWAITTNSSFTSSDFGSISNTFTASSYDVGTTSHITIPSDHAATLLPKLSTTTGTVTLTLSNSSNSNLASCTISLRHNSVKTYHSQIDIIADQDWTVPNTAYDMVISLKGGNGGNGGNDAGGSGNASGAGGSGGIANPSLIYIPNTNLSSISNKLIINLGSAGGDGANSSGVTHGKGGASNMVPGNDGGDGPSSGGGGGGGGATGIYYNASNILSIAGGGGGGGGGSQARAGGNGGATDSNGFGGANNTTNTNTGGGGGGLGGLGGTNNSVSVYGYNLVNTYGISNGAGGVGYADGGGGGGGGGGYPSGGGGSGGIDYEGGTTGCGGAGGGGGSSYINYTIATQTIPPSIPNITPVLSINGYVSIIYSTLSQS